MPQTLASGLGLLPAAVGDALLRAADVLGASKMVLFGSHARGDADAASDIDLLIVAPELDQSVTCQQRVLRMLRPVARSHGIDLVLHDEASFDRRRQAGDPFLLLILSEGVDLLATR